MTTQTQTRKLCLCGCGGTPKGTKSRYCPGHDLKLNMRKAREGGTLE